MKRRSKWLSLLLSASLVFGMTATAYADETEGLSDTGSVIETVEEGPESEIEQAGEGIEEAAEEDSSLPEEDLEATDHQEAKETSVQVMDHGDGKIDLSLKNYTKADDVDFIYYVVWSRANGQDDIKWYHADSEQKYQMNTRNHGDELGEYIVHVYEVKNTGGMGLVCTGNIDVTSIVRDEPTLSASDVDGNEKKFRISLTNYEKPEDGQAVQIAVWSAEKGQDDIAWYTLKENADGTWTYDLDPSNFKHDGSFYVHAYGQSKSGKMTYIGDTTFKVTSPTVSEITVSEIDSAKGTCKVQVKGITCPSGVTKVTIPVWSTSNQSDIYWYEAKKVSEGSYEATINISNHKFNVGPFNIHVYATSGLGFTKYVGNSKVKFDVADTIVTATKKDNKYLLGTANISNPGNVKEIIYAVWSQVNGQDDIKWYTGTFTAATRSAQYSMSLTDFKDSGKYFVHCYAKMSDGSMVFQGDTSFDVKAVEVGDIEFTVDPDSGDFKILIKGLKSDSGIEKVQVPVWSKSNQSDIYWYDAKKDSAGNYVVNGNVSKHSYNSGTYQAHVYVTEKSGWRTNVARKTFEVKLTDGVIKVTGSDQITYTATALGIKLPGGVKGLQFAVWSQKNGQDDIKWYDAEKVSDGNYKATISIKNHKTAGTYFVHAYAENSAGKKVYVGCTDFSVNVSSTASLTYADSSTYDGFNVTVNITGASCAISKVKIPVWSKSDQSDLAWYTGTVTSTGNGSYTSTVNVKVANHQMNTGKYNVHCYAVYQNGIEGIAGGSTYSYNPPYVLGVSKTGNGTRKATLKYASNASKVQFAVWSDTKGQDDIYWYTASKQSDGSFTATIKSLNHKSSGNYQVHCYVDGKFVGATTFSFDAGEMVKQGWYYENGYKFYYKDGNKLTDLTAIIGPQAAGSYVAKVNRVTCTITIYANDPDSNQGYIIPVIAFTCSVGLPETPTTLGVHYTFAKYRWKELMGPSWGQYATKFTQDGIYFHSVAGSNTTPYNLNYIDYNNLGIPASHGCVRLCVRDAKWIYDNCERGMKVIVYDSGDPGPYGKPATIKIPAGQTWDPTDPAVPH